ncbi:E3 ubiquitin-protein ligase RBBP6-like [Rhynochetos jubatus]
MSLCTGPAIFQCQSSLGDRTEGQKQWLEMRTHNAARPEQENLDTYIPGPKEMQRTGEERGAGQGGSVEYTDDKALIAKNSSVIVRIPVGGAQTTSKTDAVAPQSHRIPGTPFRYGTEPGSGISKPIGGSSHPLSLAQLIKLPAAQTANLAEASTSEEEKIEAMMAQSCQDYHPPHYTRNPWCSPAPSYTCFRCRKPGHYKKNCPTKGDTNFKPVPRIKRSAGIPRSFVTEVTDPKTKGAMLTNSEKYAIPTINAEAYARGKKEKPLFSAEEPSSSSLKDPVPEELLCLICRDIMTDAAIIPCCGNSFCDYCVRTALLESEEHRCPTCHQTKVSPDALVANKSLRKAVNNFQNVTGYTRLIKKIQQQEQLPPPPPPPVAALPPAALGSAAEAPQTSSLSVSSSLGEKVQVSP